MQWFFFVAAIAAEGRQTFDAIWYGLIWDVLGSFLYE
jgi:hypothetical protein